MAIGKERQHGIQRQDLWDLATEWLGTKRVRSCRWWEDGEELAVRGQRR